MRHRTAFSLIELLVVVSIIAVLAGMLLPAVGIVRQQAKTLTCASSLRQVGMATMAYTSDQGGIIPDIVTKMDASATTTWWSALIADYAEAATGSNGTLTYSKKSVVTGCPEWTATGGWLVGYGMNFNPDRPARWNANSRWIYSGITSDVVHFAIGSISNQGSRMLLADASDYHAVVSLTRHKDRFNVLFFDGHIQALSGAAAATQVKDHPELGVP